MTNCRRVAQRRSIASVTAGKLPAFGQPCDPPDRALHAFKVNDSRGFPLDAAARADDIPVRRLRSGGRRRLGVARLSSSLLGSGLVGVECAAKGGRAVIASRRLAKDSVLAVWGGDVVRLEELKRRPFAVRRLTLQIDEDAFLVSTTEGPADWVNHSCEPNAG